MATRLGPAKKAKFSADYDKLIKVLVDARAKAGLTQAQLATRLEKPQSYVAKSETKERRLDVIEYAEFVTALGGDPIRLLRKVLKS